MDDITAMRAFFTIKKSFEEGSYDLNTISSIISEIRLYQRKLTTEQATLLLEIPLNVLGNDVELQKNKSKWQENNKGYFLGNMGFDSDFINNLKHKISSLNYGIDDIYALTKYVKENYDELSISTDYLLRIPEVTLRDDVKLSLGSNFNSSGEAFARLIEKAFS